LRPEPGLIEVGYGEWSGKTFRQLLRRRLWTAVRETPSRVRFPGGETFGEVQARAVAAVDRIVTAHRRGTVVACSHADVIRLLIAHYSGVHLDLFQRVIVSPASVTAVALGEHPPRLLRVNDTGTLADLVPSAPPPRTARGPGKR
ncbi:MAG TPA: histidine phosphatase family protein, partial [Actinomycetota bacterium]|nr:histidine phosphatase family protein [Actinomycetota bacterium]